MRLLLRQLQVGGLCRTNNTDLFLLLSVSKWSSDTRNGEARCRCRIPQAMRGLEQELRNSLAALPKNASGLDLNPNDALSVCLCVCLTSEWTQDLCASGMESRIFSIKLRLLWIISCDRGSSTSALLSGSGALRASVAMEQRMAKTARGDNQNQNVTAEASESEKIKKEIPFIHPAQSVRECACQRRAQAEQSLALSSAAPLCMSPLQAKQLRELRRVSVTWNPQQPKVTTADN